MKETEFKAIISLLEDDDPKIGDHIEQKLLSMGDEIVPRLEKAWEEEKNEIIQSRIEDIIQVIQSKGTIEELLEWRENGGGSLLRGWFLVTQYQYPELDFSTYRSIINRIASKAWLEIRAGMNVLDKLKVVTRMIFVHEKFKSDRKRPYDPGRYFLNEMLDHKVGGPISLAFLYMIICQELELTVRGIPLPGYFILTVPGHEEDLYIDVFNKGAFFTKRDLKKYLAEVKAQDDPRFYQPASNVDILKEFIKTIIICYRQQQNKEKVDEWKRFLGNIGLVE